MYNEAKIIRTMQEPKSDYIKVPKNYLPLRGLSKETLAFYDVRVVVDSSAKPDKVVFPYGPEAQKIRSLKEKEFYTTGSMRETSLFGIERFPPGSAKAITITEGEFDAMAVFQMLGSKYPVVSVRSSASAKSDCSKERDYLNSFDRIYLCLDSDTPGKKAAKEVAQLFNPNKVFFVELGNFKDANEVLEKGDAKSFVSVWYNSKQYMPKGIVSSISDLSEILGREKQKALIDYPYPSLQEMTYGIRSKELVLVTAPEKIGKTEFIRSIEYHILKNTDYNIGVIHLEEDEERTIQGLVGLHLKEPVHLPDNLVSLPDQQKALQDLIKNDGRLNIYPHFGSDDPNLIIDIIRAMVAVLGCKFVFIDHITMLVTGFEGEDERKKLDYLSTRFAELTRELDFTMVLISHVNDDGKTRGSRNIAKVADLIVSLNRNIEAKDEDSRNTTYITVRGNRFSGRTGPAGIIRFSPNTFTLSELVYDNDNQPIEWEEVA